MLASARPALPFDSYYDDPYYGGSSTADPAAVVGLVFLMLGIYALIFVVIWLANGFSWAGLFGKAGHPKWAAFVPIYNTWVIVKISGRPESHFWLQFIPYAGIYWAVLSINDLAKSFGKDTAYTVGLIFLPIVFASMLSYGEAKYLGPAYTAPEQKFQQQYGQQQYTQGNYSQQQYAQGQYGQPQYGQPAAQGYQVQDYPAQPQNPAGGYPQSGYPQAGNPQTEYPQDSNENPYGSGPTQQS